jgi:flagellar basal-body rod protein FlgC
MYGALEVSTSGLIAQRTRLEAITENIANKDSIGFQRRVVYFAPGNPAASTLAGRAGGVHVSAIQAEGGFEPRYEPGNPYADDRGYVKYPAVNIVMEQLNSNLAGRAYEANIAAAETTKTMMAQALRLLG